MRKSSTFSTKLIKLTPSAVMSKMTLLSDILYTGIGLRKDEVNEEL